MLLLYVRDNCPFSAKVLAAAKDNGITLTEKNISEKENEDFLLSHGGKHQTPYLVDEEGNRSLYGSDEIVGYLTETYAAP